MREVKRAHKIEVYRRTMLFYCGQLVLSIEAETFIKIGDEVVCVRFVKVMAVTNARCSRAFTVLSENRFIHPGVHTYRAVQSDFRLDSVTLCRGSYMRDVGNVELQHASSNVL